jgi:hypothetical protein
MTYKLEAGAALDSSHSFGPPLIDGGPFVNLNYPYLVVSTVDGGFFTDGASILFDAGALPLVGQGTYDPTHTYTENDIIIPYEPPPPPPPVITKPTITATVEPYAHVNTLKTISWTTTRTDYVITSVTGGHQSANGTAQFTAPSVLGDVRITLTAYNATTLETTTIDVAYTVIGPPTIKLRVTPTSTSKSGKISLSWEAGNSTYVTTSVTSGHQLNSDVIELVPNSLGVYTITATATSSLTNDTDIVTSLPATVTYTVV